MGRTPSAVSWKLANFARLDPTLQRRNIKGAAHGGHGEVQVWNEFSNNWEDLAFESERLLARMSAGSSGPSEEDIAFPEGTTRESLVRSRVNQRFFRDAVLAAYGSRCCITGLSMPELLNASHIVPWALDVKNRTNPRNGLCLNAIHDRAFDCGLLTITVRHKVQLSRRLLRVRENDVAAREFLLKFDGCPISLPARFAPATEFLEYHNERIFVK